MIKINKDLFAKNLLKALEKVNICSDDNIYEKCKFVIVPIQEVAKTLNSSDDVMRLWVFSDKNIKGKYLHFRSVIDLFSGLEPLYPLWINVLYKGIIEELIIIIELQTSLIFRKPSLSQNLETGHPPFKVIQ